MSAPPPRWPILETIRRWRRSWRATGEPPFELQCAGTIEVERIAQELGLSSSELRSLVSRPDERELLAKRVAGLNLGPNVLARSDPATFRDLQRVCALCGFKY